MDAAGRPVAGALVAVVWGTAPTPEIGRLTNEQGVFQVGLAPGRYRIRAVAREATGEAEVEGGQGGEILIRLRPQKAGDEREQG